MPFNPIRVLKPAALRSTITTPRFVRPRYFHTTLPRMTVTEIKTVDQFKEAIGGKKLVVLDATASWCGPCKAIAPLFVKWSDAEEYQDKAVFAKFDVDELPELTQELGIRAMPTILFFQDGEKVDTFTGANPPAILNLIAKHTE